MALSVLAIACSPRRNGNTTRLLLEGMRTAGTHVLSAFHRILNSFKKLTSRIVVYYDILI